MYEHMYIILNKLNRSLSECSGFGGFENSSVSFVAGSGDSPEDGELKVVVPEQVRFRSSDVILFGEDCGPDDRNSISGGSVITGHIHVKLTDGSVEGDVSVFLVHVVDTSPGLISQDDAKSFDMVRSFFKDLINRKDLSLSCFGF